MITRQAKASLRWLISSPPVRAVVWSVLKISEYSGRFANVMRTAAYFPHAKDLRCHWSVTIKCRENITLGEKVVIGPGCTIGAGSPIIIGDYVRVAANAIIETGGLDFSTPPPYKHSSKPITIERGVWIGYGAMILGGVTIGEYSMISAGAIVRKSLKANSFVVGPQARVHQMDPFE